MLTLKNAMAVMFLIGIGNTVSATEFASDFNFNIGLKMWINEWTNSEFDHSDREFVTIPVVGIRYQNYYSISKLFSQNGLSFE